jgi:hypothetical protein
MKIKNITVTIERTQGKPLVYAINPFTVGASSFAMIRGMAAGYIESQQLEGKEVRRRGVRKNSV